MIDSLADAGWLAEVGALDGPSSNGAVPGEPDALTATLFSDDPDTPRTAIGAYADAAATGGVDEMSARVLAHLGR